MYASLGLNDSKSLCHDGYKVTGVTSDDGMCQLIWVVHVVARKPFNFVNNSVALLGYLLKWKGPWCVKETICWCQSYRNILPVKDLVIHFLQVMTPLTAAAPRVNIVLPSWTILRRRSEKTKKPRTSPLLCRPRSLRLQWYQFPHPGRSPPNRPPSPWILSCRPNSPALACICLTSGLSLMETLTL